VRFSVVIPTWNGRRLLHLPLDSLRQQVHRDFEVILVDDASSDGTAGFVASIWPEVRVVRGEANRGFPGAVNAGIRVATGEVIVLLNNDAAADPHWLEQIQAALEEHPEAGMVACRVLLYHHRAYLDSAGIHASTSGSAGNRGGYCLDGPEFGRPAWVLGPNGAAAVYRREVLADVGLFDEDHGAYHEDLDLALRAQYRGWKCLYWPLALCFHVGNATYATLPLDGEGAGVNLPGPVAETPVPPPASDRVVFYSSQNYPAILLKFLPLRILLADSWAIAAYEANMVFFAWRHRQLRPYWRGRVAFLRALPGTLAKRRRIARGRRLSQAQAVALFERPCLGQFWRILRRRLGLGLG